MPFTPYAFDESITRVEESGTKVRPGEYLLEIVGGQPTDEDHEGPAGAYWRVKIDKGPEGIGKPMRHFTTFKQDATDPGKSGQFGIGRLMFICGYDPSKLVGKGAQNYETHVAVVQGMAKGLIGKKIGASIDDDQYNNRVFSKIFSVYPEAEYEERAKANDPPRAERPVNGSAAAVLTPPAPADMSAFNAGVDAMFSETPAAQQGPVTVIDPAPATPATGFTLE